MNRWCVVRTATCVLSLRCVAAVSLALLSTGARAQETQVQAARDVSLAELLAFAEKNAPASQVAAQRRGYGEAAKAAADPPLRHNPTFEFGIGPRFDRTTDVDFDFVAGLGQPVELFGERRMRQGAAGRLAARVDAEAASVAWEVRRDVTATYRAAVIAKELIAISDALVHFAEEMQTITAKRSAVGDATTIDERFAEADLAEARQVLVAARQELRAAQLRLAELTGWSIENPPNVVAGIEVPVAPPALQAVLASIQREHPELAARRASTAESEARVQLADREARAVPTFGVQAAREGSAGAPANYIVLGTVATPLRFWQRNQGERARTRVDQQVAHAEEELTARALRVRIASAHAAVAAAFERVEIFTAKVAPSFESSLALLRRGYEAGELPLFSVATARERFLQVQRAALRAYADYFHAQAELEFALGAPLPKNP